MSQAIDHQQSEEFGAAVSVPAYMADAAKRGLQYHEDGHGGDGLVPQTIADARQMAGGSVSEAKLAKIGPWIARHLVDLDAPQNRNKQDPGYPGPGLVAHLLWGSGPSKEKARAAMKWANAQTEKIKKLEKASERRVLVADAWYGMPHPWYSLQQAMLQQQPQNGEPLPLPSRVIFEYDPPAPEPIPSEFGMPDIPADGYPTLDREVSYQVKYFSTHGYWPSGQMSGLPSYSTAEMQMVRTIATLIVTHPQAAVSVTTRDRLEAKGLLN